MAAQPLEGLPPAHITIRASTRTLGMKYVVKVFHDVGDQELTMVEGARGRGTAKARIKIPPHKTWEFVLSGGCMDEKNAKRILSSFVDDLSFEFPDERDFEVCYTHSPWFGRWDNHCGGLMRATTGMR